MPANVTPIFTVTPNIAWTASFQTGAGDYDGTGTANLLAFTAGANGSFLEKLRIKGINSPTASVLRVYINNGSTHTTAANNTFYGEVLLPLITASTTLSTPDIEYPINEALPAGYTIYVGTGTSQSASNAWTVTAVGGNY